MSTFSYRLVVEMFDGTVHDVTTGAADMIRLERQYKVGGSQLAKEQRLEWLLFLAHCALARSANGSGPPPPFEQWWPQAREVAVDPDDDEAAPGEAPAPAAGASGESPS